MWSVFLNLELAASWRGAILDVGLWFWTLNSGLLQDKPGSEGQGVCFFCNMFRYMGRQGGEELNFSWKMTVHLYIQGHRGMTSFWNNKDLFSRTVTSAISYKILHQTNLNKYRSVITHSNQLEIIVTLHSFHHTAAWYVALPWGAAFFRIAHHITQALWCEWDA